MIQVPLIGEEINQLNYIRMVIAIGDARQHRTGVHVHNIIETHQLLDLAQ